MTGERQEVATALRQIARGFDALATAILAEPDDQDARTQAVLVEWGARGLDRAEASRLFRRHGFAPQAAGGWTRGDWIEQRDGLRYLTERSREWLRTRG